MEHWTSEVCPSKTVTSDIGISNGRVIDVVQISIGSGPIKIDEYY